NHWGNNVHITNNTNITRTNTAIGRGASAGSSHSNNVYAGRNGSAYRRTAEGNWQQHSASGGWEGAKGSTAEHEQAHQARQAGQERVNGFNRQSSAHAAARGFHGGG